MNSTKLLLKKLLYEPTSDNKSICCLCKKPISNLLLLAHSLIHKEDSILIKSFEAASSIPPSQSINLQPYQQNQRFELKNSPRPTNASIQNESNQNSDLYPNINFHLREANIRASNPSLINNQEIVNNKRSEERHSIVKCIKRSNAFHTRIRRIEISYKRCIKLQIMKGFKMFKKCRNGR